ALVGCAGALVGCADAAVGGAAVGNAAGAQAINNSSAISATAKIGIRSVFIILLLHRIRVMHTHSVIRSTDDWRLSTDDSFLPPFTKRFPRSISRDPMIPSRRKIIIKIKITARMSKLIPYN